MHRLVLLVVLGLFGCGAGSSRTSAEAAQTAASLETIPNLPRVYLSTLHLRGGDAVPGSLAFIVAAPSQARFVVSRAVRPGELAAPLEQVELHRIGAVLDRAKLGESWGHPGAGPIEAPLLDLSDDLLVMPWDGAGDATLDLRVGDPAAPWVGKRVWLPVVDSERGLRRVEGVVTARVFGATTVDLMEALPPGVRGAPVISAERNELAGVVSQVSKRPGTGDRLLLTPADAVWQRITASELRYPLDKVIGEIEREPGTSVDRLWYAQRANTQARVDVRRVREIQGQTSWARGAWTLKTSQHESEGIAFHAQDAVLSEVSAEHEREHWSARWSSDPPLLVNATGRLVDAQADEERSWWKAEVQREDLAFAFTPSWQWRANVELVTRFNTTALFTVPAVNNPRGPLLHARITQRTSCYPNSKTRTCIRVVIYLRQRPSLEGWDTFHWLAAQAPEGVLVRHVLVTDTTTIRPVSVRSEAFLRASAAEVDAIHTIFEQRYEQPVNPCKSEQTPPPVVQAEIEHPTAPTPVAGNAAPEYPAAARHAGIETLTKAIIEIGPSGKVEDVCIVDGHRWFDDPVTRALYTWRYEPARLKDGTAVKVKRVLHFPFTLR
jgi:TonB family protein